MKSSICWSVITIVACALSGCALKSESVSEETGETAEPLTVARFDPLWKQCPSPGKDGFVTWTRLDSGAYSNADIQQVVQASPGLCSAVAGVQATSFKVSGSPVGSGRYWRMVTVVLHVPAIWR